MNCRTWVNKEHPLCTCSVTQQLGRNTEYFWPTENMISRRALQNLLEWFSFFINKPSCCNENRSMKWLAIVWQLLFGNYHSFCNFAKFLDRKKALKTNTGRRFIFPYQARLGAAGEDLSAWIKTCEQHYNNHQRGNFPRYSKVVMVLPVELCWKWSVHSFFFFFFFFFLPQGNIFLLCNSHF